MIDDEGWNDAPKVGDVCGWCERVLRQCNAGKGCTCLTCFATTCGCCGDAAAVRAEVEARKVMKEGVGYNYWKLKAYPGVKCYRVEMLVASEKRREGEGKNGTEEGA